MVQAICESYDGTLPQPRGAVHLLSEHVPELGFPKSSRLRG
jgi:hypothetical protein